MHAMPLILGVLCILAIAYRYYSAFLAAKVLALDDANLTPAHTHADGQNYHPTNKWVLFGHHFAAISGAGPLIGPVLALQYGYLPGLLWLVIGVCLAGAVQDMLVLGASVRRGGKSLAEIARTELGPFASGVTSLAILFIVVIALAGLGFVVVKALGGESIPRADGTFIEIAGSSWGTFTIAATIPIALAVGWYMYRIRPGHIFEASVIGAAATLLAVVYGKDVADSAWGPWFSLSRGGITFALAVAGAARLPVELSQDRHHRAVGPGRGAGQPNVARAGDQLRVCGRRADDARRAVPVRVHLHHVRVDLGVSCAGVLGNDAEDDR
jgi:carbon starvation protein